MRTVAATSAKLAIERRLLRAKSFYGSNKPAIVYFIQTVCVIAHIAFRNNGVKHA
jgi:hypothetical protein